MQQLAVLNSAAAAQTFADYCLTQGWPVSVVVHSAAHAEIFCEAADEPQVAAELQQGFRADPDTPIEVEADALEVEDTKQTATFSGNVRVTQAGMTLTAARMTVAYSRQGGTDVNRLDATGGVVVTSADP